MVFNDSPTPFRARCLPACPAASPVGGADQSSRPQPRPRPSRGGGRAGRGAHLPAPPRPGRRAAVRGRQAEAMAAADPPGTGDLSQLVSAGRAPAGKPAAGSGVRVWGPPLLRGSAGAGALTGTGGSPGTAGRRKAERRRRGAGGGAAAGRFLRPGLARLPRLAGL